METEKSFTWFNKIFCVLQKNVQVQSQSQPGQPYRAVPDGGYSFVSDAGQVKKEFTQAESEKATGSTGENVTKIKENRDGTV